MRLNGKHLRRVHFIGVSGIGVSAAASISLEEGLEVSGSADVRNEQTDMLAAKGMDFFLGHRAQNLGGAEWVVRSAAVPDDNPEVLEAKRRGVPVCFYSEYIGLLMGEKKGIAVAGTHGKTTTTALVASILSASRLDPTVVCGGVMRNFGTNAVHGKGEYFVAEACEYNRSFHDLKARYSVVTNIEPDHLDYYKDLEEIREAFLLFLASSDRRGLCVLNGDDANVRALLGKLGGREFYTVGTDERNDYRIDGIENSEGLYSCNLTRGGSGLLALGLSIPGRFNCWNAALASVLALRIGVERKVIEGAVKGFFGTKRRLERLGTARGREIYSDYAHHPTEIRSSLRAVRERHPGAEITLVFQPHQFSRTIELFDDFVSVLSEPDRLLLVEIYWQRDSERYLKRIGGEDLFKAVQKKKSGGGPTRAFFIPDKKDVPRFLDTLPDAAGVVVFMGAGDVDDVARSYAAAAGGAI